MKRQRLLFGLTSLLFLSTANSQTQVSLEDTVSRFRNSVVLIETQIRNEANGAVGSQFGTGFLLSADGYLLTSEHVVAPPNGFTVKEITGRIGSRSATPQQLHFILRSPSQDGALLKFANTAARYRTIPVNNAPMSIPDGAQLYVLGFLGTEEWFQDKGTLSGKGAPEGAWNTTMTFSGGISGAPILDASGRVVAIAWGGIPQSAGEHNRVIPINHLWDLLNAAGAAACQQTPDLTHMDPSEQVARQVLDGIDLIDGYASTAAFDNGFAVMGFSLEDENLKIVVTVPKGSHPSLRITEGNLRSNQARNYATARSKVVCRGDFVAGAHLCDTTATVVTAARPPRDGTSTPQLEQTWLIPLDEIDFGYQSARIQLMVGGTMVHRQKVKWPPALPP
jgi:hypothetical protein